MSYADSAKRRPLESAPREIGQIAPFLGVQRFSPTSRQVSVPSTTGQSPRILLSSTSPTADSPCGAVLPLPVFTVCVTITAVASTEMTNLDRPANFPGLAYSQPLSWKGYKFVPGGANHQPVLYRAPRRIASSLLPNGILSRVPVSALEAR